MSLLSSAAVLRHPAGQWLSWCLRLGLGLLLAGLSLSLLAWLTFHWGILPRLDDWRPRLEAAVGQRLGVTVQIGQLQARSSGWVPAFTLTDVVLRDAQGREALRLPQVSAALSVPSLLRLQPRFAQLLIDGARLEVRRTRQGQWLVAGMDMAAEGPVVDSSAAADWLFEQDEFVIRGGQLRWVDDLRGAPPLALQQVQLVLRNAGRRHALRLDATPPPSWGERFQVVVQARQPLLTREGFTRAGDWRKWSGTLFAELPRVDAAQLRRHVDLPVDLQQGRAALRAWLDWDSAEPQGLTLDAQLQDVRLQLGPGLAPLDLADAGLRLQARREADGLQLALQGLRFSLPDGRRWAPSELALQGQWASGAATAAAASAVAAGASALPGATWPLAGGRLQADRLDLELLAALAERLPIGVGVRRLLAQLSPEGTVQGLDLSWRGPLDAPQQWQARGSVRGMAMAAAASPQPGGIGRPGWRGADLEVNASQAGGSASLRLDGGSLTFPGVFEQPQLALKQLAAQLQWRVQPQAGAAPRIELQVSQARFANDDAEGTLEASWHSGAGSGLGKGGRLPGVLTLQGGLSRGQAGSVARYLPTGLPAHVRQWVRHAVQAGEVRDVSFRVKGDLWDFPFVHRNEGEFRIAGQVVGLTLAPVPSTPGSASEPAWTSPWPAFTQVSGALVFERDAMQFSQARGRLWGLELAEVQGRIHELGPQAVLAVQGQVQGPAADLLRYVRATPLHDWTGQALAAASVNGQAELKLALNMPLAHLTDTTVQARLQLAGNDLRLRPDVPLLAAAQGQVEITHKGVQLHGLRTQVLGGEAQIDGGTQPDGLLRLQVAGTASAEAMRRVTEWPWLAQAAQRLQGQAAYRLQLGLVRGVPEIVLTSNLQGMAIDLPAPLAKPADQARALRLRTQLQPAEGTTALRDQVRLELGPLQLLLLRDLDGAQPLVLRSALAYASALPDPVAGGRAVLVLPRLDVDAWRALAEPGGPLATASGQAVAVEALVPHSIRLQTPELLAMGRRLTGVTLELQRQPGPAEPAWRAQVQADQTQGSIIYREPRPGQDSGRLQARLSRLVLPPAEAEQVSGLLAEAPASVPALDIEVEQFELRGRPFGRLVVQAINRPVTVGGQNRTEWQLAHLRLENPDARLQAQGVWQPAATAGARRVELQFTLAIADAGKLLERLGFGRVVHGSRGELAGTLGWDGSPLALHVPSLGGAFKLALSQGQFLKADAGAARLLGVLSLQSLPRRLVLDFSDLFQEGFAFDDATGDLRIARGVLSTNNLRMRGVQAAVLLEGSADIARETQDLHAVVLPEINAASASLAYAVINPAVGLGTLFGQWLLREPLRQANAREFRITGGWDDPQVTRIERRITDPLPPHAAERADAAAAAAAERAASAAGAARPGVGASRPAP
jgi:uncharacterized protein (TIGR02099 family)